MEDIRESVNEIMNEHCSEQSKREKLIKIGLRDEDCYIILHEYKAKKKAERKAREEAAREAREAAEEARRRYDETLDNIYRLYTFGVEIECYNVNPVNLIASAVNKGVSMHHENYNHRDNNTYYKLVSDSSILGNNPIECVSPILNGARGGMNSLKATCEALNEEGARVNKSTGLHVHVGGVTNSKQYANTFINYYFLQSVIDSFLSPSRRNSRWASHITANECERIANINSECNDVIETIGSIMNYDRYHVVNPESFSRHRTIEFRQHQGSTDFTKISMWVRFCVKLVHYSAKNRLSARVSSVDEILFLDAEEKEYFKSRVSHFANMAQ